MTDFLVALADTGASIVSDPDAMEAYRRDQCLLAVAGHPLAVARATSLEQVVAVVSLCREHAVPVVTRGAGTGLAGGANALDGCVVLAVGGMDRILEINDVSRIARVQPGVLNGTLDMAASRHGLWYAPDPGSRDICSIGGNIATNAGGMCCAKYGVTRDHVLALTVVLGTGDVLRLGSTTRKDVAGLDVTQLFVGSEGTLGVIVEATLRLRPRPTELATVAATFPTTRAATAFVLDLGRECDAAAVEMMDRTTVRAVNSLTHMGLDETAGAVLLAQFDGPGAYDQSRRCAAIAETHGAEAFFTTDPDEGTALMAARRAALPALERLGTTLLDDVCVDTDRLPQLMESVDQAAARHEVLIGTFGHAADGNLHPTIVFDPVDARERRAAEAAFAEILTAAIDLGGTVTGEHGVGSLKVPFVESQLGRLERDYMRRVKTVFDPDGILNPGRAY